MLSRPLATLVALSVLALVSGCTTTSPQAHSTRTPSPTSTAGKPSGTPSTAPPPPAAPRVGSCHHLGIEAVSAPTDSRPPVPCHSTHTTVTVHVGHFDPVSDGHLLGVDSRSVQRQIADACSGTLWRPLGGSREARRLSRFAVEWFSPTVAQAQAGATWFRCDAVALASRDRLAALPNPFRGVLDHPRALDRFGTCGTAAPDSRRFERVICAQPHRWRAVSVVNLPSGTRFHGRAGGAKADARCKQLAANAARGALRYSWAFEWPTRQQWNAGRRYGFCWLPSR